MSVTLPGAPLSGRPAGVFNGEVQAPGHLLYFEPTHKRIRVEFGGETIADTTGAHLLYETGLLPVYYIPEADVRTDLLTRTDHTTHCPVKGDAAYWTVSAGGRTAENAVWGYPSPIAPWMSHASVCMRPSSRAFMSMNASIPWSSWIGSRNRRSSA